MAEQVSANILRIIEPKRMKKVIIFETINLTKTFGGLKALDRVSTTATTVYKFVKT